MKILLTFLLTALLGGAAVTYASDDADEREITRILVTFADPGMSNAARAGPGRPAYSRRTSAYLVSFGVKRAARKIAREFDLSVVDEWPIVPLKVHCLVYGVSTDVPVEQLLNRLRARPEIESAQLLNEFEVSAERVSELSDPYAKLQHSLRTLEITQAHTWSRGDGASVTIIDTGADVGHPELKNRIRDFRNFVNDDAAGFAADAHGTAVAGIIGASSNNGVGIVGVAPSAQVSVLKACWYGDTGSKAVCNSFTLAKALSHAVDSDTHVVNLSLGGPPDPLLTRLVDLALERGIVVVAAAPTSAPAGFPADISGVIVVGTGEIDEPADLPVIAPGNEILVPVPGGGFDYASGSSLSAAHVSGIVALLVATRPGLEHGEVARLLLASRHTSGASVSACRALATLLQQSGCRESTTAAQSL